MLLFLICAFVMMAVGLSIVFFAAQSVWFIPMVITTVAYFGWMMNSGWLKREFERDDRDMWR